jgi:hypothetical protein
MILKWYGGIQNITKSSSGSASNLRRNKLTSERASKHGGRVGPRAASRGASEQALKRRKRIQAASAECVPNHSLRGKVFRGGLRADQGPRCF